MTNLEDKLNKKFEKLDNTDLIEKRKELEILVMNQLSATGTIIFACMPQIGVVGELICAIYNNFTGTKLEKKIFKDYEKEFEQYKEKKDYKSIKQNMMKYFPYSTGFSRGMLFGMALAFAAYILKVPFGDEGKELCYNLIQYPLAWGVLNGTIALSYNPRYRKKDEEL